MAGDVGVRVTCAGCGGSVLQKAMIPVRGEGPHGVRYLCIECARKQVVTRGEPESDGAGDPADPPADRP